MKDWFKGVFGMSAVADDSQRPTRERQSTRELNAQSFARQERAKTRVEKVDRLIGELADEPSEPLQADPKILFPESPPDLNVAVMPQRSLRARRMETDFVVRTKARAVVQGEAGDWLVEYPGGDLSVYTNEEFRAAFRP